MIHTVERECSKNVSQERVIVFNCLCWFAVHRSQGTKVNASPWACSQLNSIPIGCKSTQAVLNSWLSQEVSTPSTCNTRKNLWILFDISWKAGERTTQTKPSQAKPSQAKPFFLNTLRLFYSKSFRRYSKSLWVLFFKASRFYYLKLLGSSFSKLLGSVRKAKPSQTKPNQAKPNQAKPSQAKPNQAKPFFSNTLRLFYSKSF